MPGAWGDDDDVGEVRLEDVTAKEVTRSEGGGVLLACDDWPAPVWFPLKLVEDNRDGTWAIPEWLLIERRLV